MLVLHQYDVYDAGKMRGRRGPHFVDVAGSQNLTGGHRFIPATSPLWTSRAFCCGEKFMCTIPHVLNARVSLRTKNPRRPQWGRRGYNPVSPCKVLAIRDVHKLGPATSTHFTRVVHVILMLVLHQSDVNFFVDVAGSCVYAAGPNLWTSRIAKTLHGDTGLYPRSPH